MPTVVAFGTPRKLPKPASLNGRVGVLDIAFAGGVGAGGFDQVTKPFLKGLGDRLAVWVDHHDHELHGAYSADPRFVLATKAQHGACPEMIDAALVERVGPLDTIVCHTDFDGLASAAKWLCGGREPYVGCDDDARAIDTRIGTPSATAERIDRAIRARPRDNALFTAIVRMLEAGCADDVLWAPIDAAAAELIPIERETRRAAAQYKRLSGGVAYIDITVGFDTVDKTQLLLAGQELERVSVVVDRETVSVAAGFESGLDFVKLLGLGGGMPTRVSVPRNKLTGTLRALGVGKDDIERLS